MQSERPDVDNVRRLVAVRLKAFGLPESDIDDVTHEAVLRVLQVSGQETIEASRLRALVYSTCNNVLSDHFRLESRLVLLENELPPPRDDTNVEVEGIDRRAGIREALNRMPKRDREILTRLFLEEQDRAEIIRELGIARAFLRVLLHRAKKNFLKAWQEDQRSTARTSANANTGDELQEKRAGLLSAKYRGILSTAESEQLAAIESQLEDIQVREADEADRSCYDGSRAQRIESALDRVGDMIQQLVASQAPNSTARGAEPLPGGKDDGTLHP